MKSDNSIVCGSTFKIKDTSIAYTYITVDKVKYHWSKIKSVQTADLFIVNVSHLPGQCMFARQVKAGKINVYEPYIFTTASHSYYQKGSGEIKRLQWKNLKNDVADAPHVKKILSSRNDLTVLQLISLGGGIGIVAASSTIEDPAPIFITGALITVSSFIPAALKKKNLRKAIDLYNGDSKDQFPGF